MSSESISPAAFYAQRGFGYTRFEKIVQNNLDHRIILYEHYPLFQLNNNEFEQYPMVIQIDTRQLKENIIKCDKEHKHVFYTEETIYLNPYSTVFYFNNASERQSTFVKSEASIESKMVKVYVRCLRVFDKKTLNKFQPFDCKANNFIDSTLNLEAIEKDKRINKLKGFLYGYIIGTSQSTDADKVKFLNLQTRLRNLLVSAYHDPNKALPEIQENQLQLLYDEIDNYFDEQNGLVMKLDDLIKRYQNKEIDPKTFIKGIKGISASKNSHIPRFYLKGFDKKDNLLSTIDLYLKSIQPANQASQPRPWTIEDFPSIRDYKIQIIPKQKPFLAQLYNEFLHPKFTSESFLSSRYSFAFAGGSIFKEELGDQWTSSPIKGYINGLFHNLQEYQKFELRSINNLTLNSFAAFCQKGNKEIDDLNRYLISNEIGDVRIAFGLWGLIFGFANMSKLFTAPLLNPTTNSNDFAKVYSYINLQIHGFDINPKMQVTLQPSAQTSQQPISGHNTAPSNNNPDKINQLVRKSTSQKKIQIKIIEILHDMDYCINDALFLQFKKVNGLGDITLEKLKVLLKPFETPEISTEDVTPTKPMVTQKSKAQSISKKTKPSNPEPDLFGGHQDEPSTSKQVGSTSSLFYNDPRAYSLIEPLLKTPEQKEQVKKDLDWFQDNHIKGKDKDQYVDNTKDNSSVTEHFKYYLSGKRKNKNEIISSIYNQIDIEGIITKIRKHYDIR